MKLENFDWCKNCVDAGCAIYKQDVYHRMFGWMFIDVMRLAKEKACYIDFDFDIQSDKVIVNLSKNFYNEFIKNENPIDKLWFLKDYWMFMRHLICEAFANEKGLKDIKLFDYAFKVNVVKDGEIQFIFRR